LRKESKSNLILNERFATLDSPISNRVEKRGDRWCVVHGHPKKAGSKTDKPEGSIIKCFSGPDAKSRAQAMHKAIMANNEGEGNMVTLFSNVTLNLKADKAKTRYETLEGKQYLVVPCVMLTEGVHEGSQGPLYYPAKELSKIPAIWNAKPVVVYHPQMNGMSISACDPVIFEKQKIGILMNTKWEDGKLKTECWIDEEKTKAVDERVINAISTGQMMEVSTGLFTDNEQTEGEWNGEKYEQIARNYRPDHLAILPDLKGACSIADGAGLLRNAAELQGAEKLLADSLAATFNELSHNDIWGKINDKIRSGPDSDAWVNVVFDSFFIYEKGSKTYYQEYEIADDEVKLVGVRKEAEKILQYKLSDGTMVGNAEMKTEGGSKYPASAYAYVPDPKKPSTWKLRLWETPEKKETAAQVGRAIAAIGKGFRGQKVQLPASAVKGVKAKIRAAWKRTNPDKKASDMPSVLLNMKEDFGMNKEQIVDGLIANEKSPWTEEDREGLMEMDVEKLQWIANQAKEQTPPELKKEETKVAPPAEPKKEETKVDEPTGNKEVTMDEYIANAPEGMRDMLVAGIKAHEAQKAEMIQKITANERNGFSEEQLKAKGLDELRTLARLAEVPVTQPKAPAKPLFNGQAEVTNQGDKKEEPLAAPTLNFEKAEK